MAEFTYDPAALELLERQFLLRCGEFIGVFKHVGLQHQDTLKIEFLSDEAAKTSEIEGEVLDRESVQTRAVTIGGVSHTSRLLTADLYGVTRLKRICRPKVAIHQVYSSGTRRSLSAHAGS